jgi:hypothetical protein
VAKHYHNVFLLKGLSLSVDTPTGTPFYVKFRQKPLAGSMLNGKGESRRIDHFAMYADTAEAFFKQDEKRQLEIVEAIFKVVKDFWVWEGISGSELDQFPFLDLTPEQIRDANVSDIFAGRGKIRGNMPYYEGTTGTLTVRAKPGTATIVQDVKDENGSPKGKTYAISDAKLEIGTNDQHRVSQATSFEGGWIMDMSTVVIMPVTSNVLVIDQVYGEGTICGICFDNKPEVILACGHGLCRGCKQDWQGPGSNSCPFCRKSMKVKHST